MITKLTREQEDLLAVYRDKWIKIGLSTAPVNTELAMKAITMVYAAGGLVAPDRCEVYASPFEAIREMKLRYGIDVSVHDFAYGSQDASWLSHYSYFQEVVGIESCNALSGLVELAKHTGWWLPFDEMVVFTHNPVHIRMDDENRTHCEDDYAIKFQDGTGVAAWHGICVPAEWIFDKSSITPEVMLQWPNVEERRCACEIVGWVNVLKHLEATTVDKDPDETVGTLLEVNLPDSGREKFLVALDPNVNKIVGIPVPPEMKTALEANSWSYGIDIFEFKPEFRV